MTQHKPDQVQKPNALLASEDHFRLLVEGVEDHAIYLLDAQGRVASWNKGAERLKGYHEADILGQPFSLFFSREEIANGKPQHLLATAARVGRVEDEGWRIRQDGARFWANGVITALRNEDGSVYGFAEITRDLTQRRQADDQIRRLNRTLAVLSDVNQTIVRTRELPVLFAEACRVAVEKGGFRMAWVGLLDSGRQRVDPVAHAGVEDGYLASLKIDLADELRGRGPVGMALRSGMHVVCNDIDHDPAMAPWRADALRQGYRALATFPLLIAGMARGTFTLYAVEPDFFEAEDLKLLDELAADLAFAMEFAEQEAQRKEAEASLQRYTQRLEIMQVEQQRQAHALAELGTFLQSTLDAFSANVAVLDRAGAIISINARWRQFCTENQGQSPTHYLGENYLAVCDRASGSMAAAAAPAAAGIRAVIAGQQDYFYLEYPCPSATVERWFGLRVTPFAEAAPRRVVVAHTDISERKRAEAGERAQRQFAEAMRDSLAALSGPLDVDGVMQQILASAVTVVPSEAGSIILFEDDKGRVAYLRGFTPEVTAQLIDYPIAPEAWPYGNILTRRQPYIVADAHATEGWTSIPATTWIRSSLGVPIERRGAVIGALIVASATPNRFAQTEIEKLQAFGHYASLALENAYHVTHLEQSVAARTVELNAANKQLAAILNHSLDSILLVQPDLRIAQMNAEFARMFRCPSDDYIGRSLLDLFGTGFAEQVCASVEAVVSAQTGHQIEVRACREDGTEFNAELSLGFIKDDGLVCTIRDITERKRIEATLQAKTEEEREFQGHLKTLHELTIELASLNELDTFYKRAVELGLEHFGFERLGLLLYDPEQALAIGTYGTDAQGRVIAEPHIRLDPKAHSGILQRTLESSERFFFDEQAQLYSNYQPIGVGWNAMAVLWNAGQTLGWLGADNGVQHKPVTKPLLDVLALYSSTLGTLLARKRLEATLREKNVELEKAIRAKDHFLATMSHELRTPLNAIIGYTGTLLMKLPGPLLPDQERQLRTIQTSARHLLSLISDLLDLAKIDSGKVELYLEPVNCLELIEEVSTILRPLAAAKGLRFAVELAADDIMLISDRRSLSQILINLGNNAIKFTEHGEVRLCLAQYHKEGRPRTEISVVDTGVGLRPADQAELFQAFVQLEGGLKRQEGTGLGLYLSQKLAALLGGKITCQSEYGRGSTFTLTIERASTELAGDRSDEQNGPDPGDRR